MACLDRVIAAQIHGFADFRHRIIERLAALGLQQRDEAAVLCFDQGGGALQRGGARRHRGRVPGRKARLRRCDGGRHDGLVAFADLAERRAIDGGAHRAPASCHCNAVDQRHRPRLCGAPARTSAHSRARLSACPNSMPAEFIRSGP